MSDSQHDGNREAIANRTLPSPPVSQSIDWYAEGEERMAVRRGCQQPAPSGLTLGALAEWVAPSHVGFAGFPRFYCIPGSRVDIDCHLT